MSHITWIPAPRRLYFLGTAQDADGLRRPQLVPSWRRDHGTHHDVCHWQIVVPEQAPRAPHNEEEPHGRRKESPGCGASHTAAGHPLSTPNHGCRRPPQTSDEVRRGNAVGRPQHADGVPIMVKKIEAEPLTLLLDRNEEAAATTALEPLHPFDIAACSAELPQPAALRTLRLLPEKRQARVFGYLDPAEQLVFAREMSRTDLARLLSAMDPDQRADLYKNLPVLQAEALLPALAHAEREDLRRLAAYPEGTAGAIMTSAYATLPPDLTAQAAMERLRHEAPDRETVFELHVIDAERRLLGTLSLRELLVAPATARISDLMHRDPMFARVGDPREEVAAKISQYDLLALPVVNGGDKLVGIVTQDDAMDVQQEEATLDFRKHGSVGPMTMSMTSVSVWMLYRARIAWLVLPVFGDIFSGAGIAAFEDMIAANVALVFFLPLLIDSGGNAGSQAATLMVRALATADVRKRDYGKLIGREAVVAGLLGLSMALAISVVGVVRAGPQIALVVAVSMVIIVIVGSTIGMSLPFVLSRFGRDPATASAPLVISIADAVGVLIYSASPLRLRLRGRVTVPRSIARGIR